MPRIEELWRELKQHGVAAQRRVAEKGCDIYADFAPPDQVGLVAVCDDRPPLPRSLSAITVERGERADGRCSLRLSLRHEALLPVFAALCRDIVNSNSEVIDQAQLGQAVLNRLEHWRTLLERDSSGLEDITLRGLIGELTILETKLLPVMSAIDAMRAWRGPFKAPQDFLLPDGNRIEVKAIDRNADAVTINGLTQLDPGTDHLKLAVVRLHVTGPSAEHAVTAPKLIARIRAFLAAHAEATTIFEAALAQLGWHHDPSHDELAVRILAIEAYVVGDEFPRLTYQNVPLGIDDVTYRVSLRGHPYESWQVVT